MTASTSDHSAPEPPRPEPVLDAASLTALRTPAVRRLLVLRAQRRRLTRAHVHTNACFGQGG
ncbi:hypothetical protein [Streptomyces sp. 3N207]|uniref:hypothetical protein n=1 Tax=Streptomyces sp. 3N207 TaxID=3457417 RepID=UPI003FCFF68F